MENTTVLITAMKSTVVSIINIIARIIAVYDCTDLKTRALGLVQSYTPLPSRSLMAQMVRVSD